MKNKRFYLGVIIILVLVNLGTLAFLMFGGSLIIPGPIRGKAPDFLIRELNLTRVQMDEFGKLRPVPEDCTRGAITCTKPSSDRASAAAHKPGDSIPSSLVSKI